MPIAHHIVRYRVHLNLVTALLAATWLGWAAYQLSTIVLPSARPAVHLLVPASEGGTCCSPSQHNVTAVLTVHKA